MKHKVAYGLAVATAAAFILPLMSFAQDLFLVDILGHPERFYNRTVTLSGQVQSVQANPVGTERGQYAISDESTTNTLTVKTERLPKIGTTYKITGMLVADPAQGNVPILKEDSRSTPGSSTSTIILVVAGIAFLGLLVLLLTVLSKSKKTPKNAPVIRPATHAPAAASPDLNKTIRVVSGTEAAASKTQVYLNLGASIVVDKGPDVGKEFPLHTLVTAIGRPGARKNDIELNDGTVSKEQATIRYDNTKKEFTLINESQTNPTRVDQKEVSAPAAIADGAVIEIGKTVLRFKKS
jgi:pSer/pThr/pTyr-binding forkhead associated (FHA) protein